MYQFLRRRGGGELPVMSWCTVRYTEKLPRIRMGIAGRVIAQLSGTFHSSFAYRWMDRILCFTVSSVTQGRTAGS
jgi:hypothetical protein